tara:strand:- start:56 stop:406 length:351 start_codon:yes stop_codon:yes gene_type:complete
MKGNNMVNRAKQKGTAFETAVVRYLSAETGAWVERRALAGAEDKGDLIGDGCLSEWCLELKDHKQINLAGFVDEAEVEGRNAGSKWFAAIVKRRNKGVKDAYVVMPLWLWTELIDQ